jgi:hypothetical protein
MAYADSRLPCGSRSEHHDSDKATHGENVKEQCPGGASPEMSAETVPMLGDGVSLYMGFRAQGSFVISGMSSSSYRIKKTARLKFLSLKF